MRYSFRLAELVGYAPAPKQRSGLITQIGDATGLDRHHIAGLLKNTRRNISLDPLAAICKYLVEHHGISADRLPGALFAVEAEDFWELLARRRRLELCVGMRRDHPESSADAAWVVASDLVLVGELFNGISTLGSAVQLKQTSDDSKAVATSTALAGSLHVQPEHIKQTLVLAPDNAAKTQVMDRALEVYGEFMKTDRDRALVALGSMKSNPIVELIIASAFHCEPFVSQDRLASARKRSCPFFLRFREHDPHPDSCCGGLKLDQSGTTDAPGIYYELPDGNWDHCSCNEKQDCAFVFYNYFEAGGRLEMALGGYSGRATRSLARSLSSIAKDLWPPVSVNDGLRIGAFIVQFSYSSLQDKQTAILTTESVDSLRVIALHSTTIRSRFPRTKAEAD
ncbi:MAG: helix-turn-helix transcriptional regulator [Planctomycetes bacterium]|nr:helix-turn-helix transcriptional regulator [Planctomycetota bacterium]